MIKKFVKAISIISAAKAGMQQASMVPGTTSDTRVDVKMYMASRPRYKKPTACREIILSLPAPRHLRRCLREICTNEVVKSQHISDRNDADGCRGARSCPGPAANGSLVTRMTIVRPPSARVGGSQEQRQLSGVVG